MGRHLLRRLEECGHDGFFTFSTKGEAGPRSAYLNLPGEEECLVVLRKFRPEAVVHLGGISAVPDAEQFPVAAFQVNVEGTASLVKALHRFDSGGGVRFVFASTAQVYEVRSGAASAGGASISESSPLGPQNTYARTKLAAELAAQVLASASSRPVVVFRPFNHIGPGQRDAFVVSSFARQVARMELGRAAPVLETGDLEVHRDFCDVRDIARAYALAAEGAVSEGAYNLASGRAVPLDAVVETLRRASTRPFEVRVRQDLLRPGEVREFRGNPRKIQSACGWQAAIPLEVSVLHALEWWRKKEREGSHG